VIAPHAQESRWDAEDGFTLIELLIATTILAFLSLLLFGGLQFGTRVWEKSQTSTTDTNHVRAAQLLLTNEIAHIYPFFFISPGSRHVEFEGSEQRMTFFSPSRSVTGEMDWVTIQAQRDKAGLSVVVTTEGELSNGHGTATRHTLIGGLKWFQMSYFGAPAPAGNSSPVNYPTVNAGLGRNSAAAAPAPPQWTAVWKGQKTLPTLIRIRAALVTKAEWPDLVVAPRVDVDEACVLDQLNKTCQGR